MSNIPHYLRLKPRGISTEAKEAPYFIESQDETHVKFKDTVAPNKFTKVFNEVSQLDLYKSTLEDLTLDTLDGKDGVFFTLGPSNSGKSYSIYGDDSNPGLVIYALNEVFNKMNGNTADYKIFKKHFGEHFLATTQAEKKCTGEYGLTLSVFEIYNDRIRDLTQDVSKTANQSLDIITDAKDGKIKPNKIRQIYVSNLDDAKLVLHKSIKRRAVSSTNLNQTSSRSHLFIYLNVHKTVGRSVKTSRLTIADLAGSERTKTAKTEGKEFKEGNYTNTSLTELGRCLALMRSKKFERSLLRTNKLTRLLLTDLFGNLNQNKIKILVTLDPYSSLSTILHALRYIQPVSRVTIASERNSLEPESELVLVLNEEIRILKEKYEELVKENEQSKEQLTAQEVTIRQELYDEYEAKIKEIDIKNTQEFNGLKESHQQLLDEKLDMLSKDYEAKIKYNEEQSVLKIGDYKKQLETLNEKFKAVESKNQDGVTDLLSENKSLVGQLKKLEFDLDSSINAKKARESELQTQISSLQEKQDKLNSELTLLKKQLEEAEKENKHLSKKEKKKAKKIEELAEKLELSNNKNKGLENNKRKSDANEDLITEEDDRITKVRKSEESQQINTFKPSFEDDLMSFSPVRISHSPSKKDKSPTKSPLKSPTKSPTKSPSKKKSFESPKKLPLHESFLNNTLPEPKVKTKSPSKGKRKLQKVKIVDDSFSD